MFIFSLVNVIGSSKQALILISLIVVITLVDSQFINVFYGTNFGTPGIEMLVFQEYNKAFSLLVTYFSHIWSALPFGFYH